MFVNVNFVSFFNGLYVFIHTCTRIIKGIVCNALLLAG